MSVKTSQIYVHRNLMMRVAVWVLLRRVQHARLRLIYPLPRSSVSVINRDFMDRPALREQTKELAGLYLSSLRNGAVSCPVVSCRCSYES
jgi:hypothetical protein